jgi:hypothetical protein
MLREGGEGEEEKGEEERVVRRRWYVDARTVDAVALDHVDEFVCCGVFPA